MLSEAARFPCGIAHSILGQCYSGWSPRRQWYVVLIQMIHSPELTISSYKHPHCDTSTVADEAGWIRACTRLLRSQGRFGEIVVVVVALLIRGNVR